MGPSITDAPQGLANSRDFVLLGRSLIPEGPHMLAFKFCFPHVLLPLQQ